LYRLACPGSGVARVDGNATPAPACTEAPKGPAAQKTLTQERLGALREFWYVKLKMSRGLVLKGEFGPGTGRGHEQEAARRPGESLSATGRYRDAGQRTGPYYAGEGTAADEEWSEEALMDAARRNAAIPLPEMIDRLFENADAFAAGIAPYDDMTLVLPRATEVIR